MLILLYSDTNYVLDGFRAEYFISNWWVCHWISSFTHKNLFSRYVRQLVTINELFIVLLFHSIRFNLVQMIARNRVNVLAINVCAKAIGLLKTAVCMRVQIVAVRLKDAAYAQKNIVDALMWVHDEMLTDFSVRRTKNNLIYIRWFDFRVTRANRAVYTKQITLATNGTIWRVLTAAYRLERHTQPFTCTKPIRCTFTVDMIWIMCLAHFRYDEIDFFPMREQQLIADSIADISFRKEHMGRRTGHFIAEQTFSGWNRQHTFEGCTASEWGGSTPLGTQKWCIILPQYFTIDFWWEFFAASSTLTVQK